MESNKPRAAALALAIAAAAFGCGSPPPPEEELPIGLMLSFSGFLAANSVNSERALRMAIESVNEAGGVAGRRIRVLARDTRSDPAKISEPARDLIARGAAVLIGPDTIDLVTQLRGVVADRTLILPSFATASIDFKPASWFVMGSGTARVACELVAQLRADGRQNPLVIMNPTGYNSSLSWELSNRYGMPKYVVPTEEAATKATVRPITGVTADAYLLAAFPTSASSLVYALTASGTLNEPAKWYLSPTLHTPAFLDFIPKGLLKGAHGVSAGNSIGGADFRTRFSERWQDVPLDDAYPFYDAGAISALALERAFVRHGVIPSGPGLREHILAVTKGGGRPIGWNELELGLQLLRAGLEIEYVGISGSTQFDSSGQTPSASTNWWTIGDDGFTEVPRQSDCQ
jgi:branched-chain amino acid transport system substrate-binding protein